MAVNKHRGNAADTWLPGGEGNPRAACLRKEKQHPVEKQVS